MEESKSLWPKIELEGNTTPRSILAEQATELSSMTNNVLKGQIYRQSMSSETSLNFGLKIVAPALNNFTILLLHIQYGLIDFYPVAIIYDGNVEEFNDEMAFREELRRIFNSPTTIKVIKSLYAQSVDE